MPGQGLPQIKCEPLSEEEEGISQFTNTYFDTQLGPCELLPVKLEPKSDELRLDKDERPSNLLHHLQASGLEALAPAGPAATPVSVCVKPEPVPPAATFETLESAPHALTGSTLIDRHLALLSASQHPDSDFMPLLHVKDEPLSEGEQHTQSGDDTSDSSTQFEPTARGSPKSWTQKDMDNALEALRSHNMSLTKASATYGIPSTTLWQRAHRLGIDTPKKEGTVKSWTEEDLRQALHALRAGAISANKASKAYGIPSSTLYKIARREGIRLAAPFNAAPTAWRRADLERALAAIRAGRASVQRAAAQFGIPTGTLYGRCKREGIELSRSNPTPWSEDAMGEALEAVSMKTPSRLSTVVSSASPSSNRFPRPSPDRRSTLSGPYHRISNSTGVQKDHSRTNRMFRVGQMSINQAAIHYNLPYSSLYGRFKRCKYQVQCLPTQQDLNPPELETNPDLYYQQPSQPVQTDDHYYIEHDPSLLSHTHEGDMYGHNQAMYYQCNSIAS